MQIGRGGYGTNFNRFFYRYERPRPFEKIAVDLKQVEAEIDELPGEVTT